MEGFSPEPSCRSIDLWMSLQLSAIFVFVTYLIWCVNCFVFFNMSITCLIYAHSNPMSWPTSSTRLWISASMGRSLSRMSKDHSLIIFTKILWLHHNIIQIHNNGWRYSTGYSRIFSTVRPNMENIRNIPWSHVGPTEHCYGCELYYGHRCRPSVTQLLNNLWCGSSSM